MVKLHLSSFIACATLLTSALAKVSSTPDVDVSIQWPEKNPFGRITNGHSSNLLHVRLNNHAGEEITVTRVYGAFREPHGRERALRNTTTLALQQPVLPGLKSPLIPYKFHSENKQGEVGLRVWVDYLDASKKLHTVLGFEGTATVSEPKGSWFDPALLFSYLVMGSLLYGLSYLLYTSYTAPTLSTSSKGKTRRSNLKAPLPAPVAVAEQEATVVGGVDEEWIPKHHVLRERKGQQSGGGGATSGEESEGAKVRKGKRG